jgi:hypothetical protein
MGRRLFYTVEVRNSLQRANAAAYALDDVIKSLDGAKDERVRQAHEHAQDARAKLELAITTLHPSYKPRRLVRKGRWRDTAGDNLLRCRLCPALVWRTNALHHLLVCHALRATDADIDVHFVEPTIGQPDVPEDADAEEAAAANEENDDE